MNNLLLPAAIAAPPPKPPEPIPPRSPAGERMLTSAELRRELANLMPFYARFRATGESAVFAKVRRLDAAVGPIGTVRLNPRAWTLPTVSDTRLRLEVVAKTILSDTRRFEMKSWTGKNECGTTHCIAGWAYELAGPASQDFLSLFHYELLGLALLGHEVVPHFYDSNEQALAFLRTVEQ
ncbi:MAG: hypothetical protein V2I26_08965 [Halieaceae bacterium]|jgi:hypothetical protein|nr:hypothetical protein [Halieaceae bacterium]